LGSFKCGVGGGQWAPYDRYFSYPAKILEKGCPTWPDNRGCTVLIYRTPAVKVLSRYHNLVFFIRAQFYLF